MKKTQLYIGLMSGTSADGIDLALVDFSEQQPQLIASYYQAYEQSVHDKITLLYNPSDNEIERAFSLDIELAHLFTNAINEFLFQQHLTSQDIIAIGNHGQTIRHKPNQKNAFTLQIGCNQTLASLTDIIVIGQFRRKDMALGGQGAPLVPAFHHVMFNEPEQDVFVVNLGGIANISYLPNIHSLNNNNTIIGYDTGPGNALMDDWFVANKKDHHSTKHYDEHGNWANNGKVNKPLLSSFLSDKFFTLIAPKSTGREYFHLTWLYEHLNKRDIAKLNLSNQDIQATLSLLTAKTIANEIKKLSSTAKVYLCGGGIHNKTLKNKLIQELTNYEILLTNHKDIDADSLEAMAFAWMAFAYNKKIFSNIPAVTGACKKAVLGTAFYP